MFVAMQICVSSRQAYAINGGYQNSRWAYYLHESVSFFIYPGCSANGGLIVAR